MAAQLLGSILASGTLCLLFNVKHDSYFGTVPVGSDVQSLVLEILISFLLMFVISGVATDNRSVSGTFFASRDHSDHRHRHHVIMRLSVSLRELNFSV